MSRSCLLAMTALAGIVIATPAEAEWVRLGSVHVEHERARDATYARFGGPVESLSFTARGSDMWCRAITAHFANGEKTRVYSGKLQQDRPVNADVPGMERRIDSVSMTCTAANRRGGELNVGANVGRFRQAWERSRDWSGHWARVFGRQVGYDEMRGWRSIGREDFQGRRDTESVFAGRREGRIEHIALRPLDSDARCTRVAATFHNGRTRELEVDRREVMERGRLTVIDLPGDERNVRRVDLTCRAVGDRNVTIEVLTRS